MKQEVTSFRAKRDGLVLTVTFARPASGNAVPPEEIPALIATLRDGLADPRVHVLLFTAEGSVFSAGADLRALERTLALPAADRQREFRQRLERARDLVEVLADSDKPIVVALNGAAAGAGLLYPLVADFVLATPAARLVFAHARIGLSPDGGVSALLTRAVGARVAKRLLLEAAVVDADQAKALGLVDRLIDADRLEDEAKALAGKLAQSAHIAMRTTKRLVQMVSGSDNLRELLNAELEGVLASVIDPDFDEGIRAAIEKRPALFPSSCTPGSPNHSDTPTQATEKN